MPKRKVEFMVDVRLGTTQHETGDICSFEESEATQYINLGWCKCVETGEVGELVPGSAKLLIPADTEQGAE